MKIKSHNAEKYNDEKLDELMKIALASQEEPGEELNRRIIQAWKERPNMKKSIKRKVTMTATAACVLLMTVTAAAAARYFTPAQIAQEAGEEIIAEAFKGESAIELNETKEAGDYRFTLLGIAPGEALVTSRVSGAIQDLKGTYAAVAIERKDGQPMPSVGDDAYNELTFFISPLIQGMKPWQYNIASMNGAYDDIVVDGVLYRLIMCDDVIKFADRNLYLCISDTAFFHTDAYGYNEITGEISRNEGYNGINLLFELPVDASQADQAAAQEYLKELEKSWNLAEEENTEDEQTLEDTIQEILDQLNQGNEEEVLKDAELIEENQTIKGQNGSYQYVYSDDSQMMVMNINVADFSSGKCYEVFNGSEDASLIRSVYVVVLTDNGDGTASARTYKKMI